MDDFENLCDEYGLTRDHFIDFWDFDKLLDEHGITQGRFIGIGEFSNESIEKLC
jgi:hypothetical protein